MEENTLPAPPSVTFPSLRLQYSQQKRPELYQPPELDKWETVLTFFDEDISCLLRMKSNNTNEGDGEKKTNDYDWLSGDEPILMFYTGFKQHIKHKTYSLCTQLQHLCRSYGIHYQQRRQRTEKSTIRCSVSGALIEFY